MPWNKTPGLDVRTPYRNSHVTDDLYRVSNHRCDSIGLFHRQLSSLYCDMKQPTTEAAVGQNIFIILKSADSGFTICYKLLNCEGSNLTK